MISTAWLWFRDKKGTQNGQKWNEILSHIGGLVVHSNKILPYLGWIGCVCQVLSPWWLKIFFHIKQFWVSFISQNHNQAVELVELFFPLSYPSNMGCLDISPNFVKKRKAFSLLFWDFNYHRLPRVTTGYQGLTQVKTGYYRLTQVNTG